MDWLIHEISEAWKSWGHTGGANQQLIVKSDGEPALVALKTAAMKYHGGVAVPEAPGKNEKAENGLVEEAGKTVRELVCTLLSQIERGIKEALPLDSNLVPWVVRWAAMCHSRYVVGRDGRTAWERLRGRTCRPVAVPCGEKVWYKKIRQGPERQNKAETEWHKGIWLGPAVGSSDTLIGADAGVLRTNAIKRLPDDEKWDADAIKAMKGTPQQPDLSKPGVHIPTWIRLEPAVPVNMGAHRPARAEEGPRRAYLKKEFFAKHGYTVECKGCQKLQASMAKDIVHTERCRKRLVEELNKTPEGRKWIEEAETRMNEYMERKHEELIAEAEKEEAAKKEEQEGCKDVLEGAAPPKTETSDSRPSSDPTESSADGMPGLPVQGEIVPRATKRGERAELDNQAKKTRTKVRADGRPDERPDKKRKRGERWPGEKNAQIR